MSKKKVNQQQNQNQETEIKENQQIGKDQPEAKKEKEKKKRRNPMKVMRDADKQFEANHPVLHKGFHIGCRIVGGAFTVLGIYSGTSATIELIHDRRAKKEALNLTSPVVPEIPTMDIPQIPVQPVVDSGEDTMTTESSEQ